MMDVVISSGWRSSQDNGNRVTPGDLPPSANRNQEERFVSRHGRYEVSVTAVPNGWKVTYTCTGRLFGPRVCIYEAIHTEPRHAAWDVMCRVIRATDDEDIGIVAGKHASAWLMEHMTVC